MQSECQCLPLKDKLILLGILVGMFLVLILSLWLPVVFTIVFVNFFLFFVLVLFFCLYLDKKNEGKAKTLVTYPSISVIVPVYNYIRTIIPCIESIKRIKYPKKIEIIVVDDGSTDGSRELLGKIKGINFIKLKENSGKAVALNTGILKVKTDFVACIDSDTYPEEEVFLKTMGFFKEKKVGAVTCLILPDKNESIVQKLQFFEYAIGFGLWTTILSSINSMTMIPGPMTIFRSSVFKKIGGYESGNLTEDMEMGLRLQKFNYKIKTCFEVQAYTDIPNTWKKLFKQRDRWYRGKIFNILNYKKLFFNSKNFDLGFFSLPYLFALELVSVVLLFRFGILFIENIFTFILVKSSVLYMNTPLVFVLKEVIISSSFIYFLISYLFVFSFFYLGLSLIGYKVKASDVPAILINIILYPLFVSIIYFQGFLKEMIGVRAKWVRVSI
jgi:poly-beta-1,6-N-acetyl-D-glucosamine synthase